MSQQQQQQQSSSMDGQLATAAGAAASSGSEEKPPSTLEDVMVLLQSMQEGMSSMQEGMSSMRQDMSQMETRLETRMEARIDYLSGNYYTPLHEIWGTERCQFDGAAKEWGDRRAKDKVAIAVYNSKEEERRRIKYDEALYPGISLFPGQYLSRAHGCPNDPTCSITWGPSLSLLTGYKADDSCMLRNDEFRYFVEGKNPFLEDGDETEKNTPLKALSWNFLKVPEHHDDHLDKVSRSSTKSMILAPVWDSSKQWTPGTAYSLIVAATPQTYTWLMGTKPPPESSPQKKWLSEASDNDLEVATDFLSLTVRALADLLVTDGDLNETLKKLEEQKIDGSEEGSPANKLEEVVFSVENGVDPSDLFSTDSASTRTPGKGKKPKTKQRVPSLQRKVKSLMNIRKKFIDDNKTVLVPVKKASINPGKAKILKVDLGVYFADQTDFIPDPYLWALKAGSAWGCYTSQKSLMACDAYGPFDCDTSDDSGDLTQDPPVEIAIMEGVENTNFGDDGSSMSSVSVCKTDSDGDRNPAAVTP